MSTTTSPTITANVDGHEHLVDDVRAHMEAGATEKQAWAVALRDGGATNEQVGAAFADLFGRPTKSGGAGNLVTAGLRAIGRDGEIRATTGTGVRHATVRDPQQLIGDELDRARAALENVTRPVADAQAALDDLATEDGARAFVNARVTDIGEKIKALQAEQKALKTDPSAALDAERERLTARLASAEKASAENADRMREAIDALELTLATLAAATR